MLAETWVRDVLTFWFEETTPAQWFRKDEAFDAQITTRFQAVHEALQDIPQETLAAEAQTTLAAIIVFDQMPRNMFRGTARQFATDTRALWLAEAALTRGYDAAMSKDQRTFIYLPFEHAEDRAAQARAVALMASLGDAELVKWAEAHRVIIDRFGRFPHRNAALGRPSTDEELAFLQQPGSAF